MLGFNFEKDDRETGDNDIFEERLGAPKAAVLVGRRLIGRQILQTPRQPLPAVVSLKYRVR